VESLAFSQARPRAFGAHGESQVSNKNSLWFRNDGQRAARQAGAKATDRESARHIFGKIRAN
jgi:hypothetical protein